MGEPFWTDARCEELKTLWITGWTCTQIAVKFGSTRNAVIGKVHRLGLSGNSRTYQNAIERRKGEKASESAPRPPRSPDVRRRQQGEAPVGSLAFKVLDAIRRPRGGPRQFISYAAVQAVDPRHLSLTDLEPDDCRFAFGDGPFTFCGCEKLKGSSYCAAHHALTHGAGTFATEAGTDEYHERMRKAARAGWQAKKARAA